MVRPSQCAGYHIRGTRGSPAGTHKTVLVVMVDTGTGKSGRREGGRWRQRWPRNKDPWHWRGTSLVDPCPQPRRCLGLQQAPQQWHVAFVLHARVCATAFIHSGYGQVSGKALLRWKPLFGLHIPCSPRSSHASLVVLQRGPVEHAPRLKCTVVCTPKTPAHKRQPVSRCSHNALPHAVRSTRQHDEGRTRQ